MSHTVYSIRNSESYLGDSGFGNLKFGEMKRNRKFVGKIFYF